MTRNQSFARLVVTAAWIALFAVVSLHDTVASAQVDVIIVPPEVIATTDPVYFEGHPVYWYNGRWMYRDARGGWGWYRDEPAFLRDRRMRAPEPRRYYGGGGYRDHGGERGGGRDFRRR